jgi:hypothetical protein
MYNPYKLSESDLLFEPSTPTLSTNRKVVNVFRILFCIIAILALTLSIIAYSSNDFTLSEQNTINEISNAINIVNVDGVETVQAESFVTLNNVNRETSQKEITGVSSMVKGEITADSIEVNTITSDIVNTPNIFTNTLSVGLLTDENKYDIILPVDEPVSVGQSLRISNLLTNTLVWANEDGTGNVSGPLSSSIGAIPSFNSTSGDLLSNSSITITNSNELGGISALTASGEAIVGSVKILGGITNQGITIESSMSSDNYSVKMPPIAPIAGQTLTASTTAAELEWTTPAGFGDMSYSLTGGATQVNEMPIFESVDGKTLTRSVAQLTSVGALSNLTSVESKSLRILGGIVNQGVTISSSSTSTDYGITLPTLAPEAGQVLSADTNTLLGWKYPSDVSYSGAASIANEISVYSGVDGKTITRSVAQLTPTGALSNLTNVESTSLRILGGIVNQGVTISSSSTSNDYGITLPTLAPQAGQVLAANTTSQLIWEFPSEDGDVSYSGAASTSNEISVFSGVDGKTITRSIAQLTPAGALTNVTSINADTIVTTGSIQSENVTIGSSLVSTTSGGLVFDSFNGNVSVSSDPTSDLGVATKQYVDNVLKVSKLNDSANGTVKTPHNIKFNESSIIKTDRITSSFGKTPFINHGQEYSFGLQKQHLIVVGCLTSSGNADPIYSLSYSSDSNNWQPIVNSKSIIPNVRSIDYNGFMWVAGGGSGSSDSNTLAYSFRGKEWFTVQPSDTGGFDSTSIVYKVKYLNGQWVAIGQVGSSSHMAVSKNGQKFTAVTMNNSPTTRLLSIAFNNNMYLIGGQGGTTLYYTYDLTTDFTVVPNWSNEINNVHDIIFDGTKWCVVGSGTQTTGYSYNFDMWVYGVSPMSYLNTIVYNGEIYNAGGGNSGTYNTSVYGYNGIGWTFRQSGSNTVRIRNIVDQMHWDGMRMISVGEDSGAGLSVLKNITNSKSCIMMNRSKDQPFKTTNSNQDIYTSAIMSNTKYENSLSFSANDVLLLTSSNSTIGYINRYNGSNLLASDFSPTTVPIIKSIAYNGKMWLAVDNSEILKYSFDNVNWFSSNIFIFGDGFGLPNFVSWQIDRWLVGYGDSSSVGNLRYSFDGFTFTTVTGIPETLTCQVQSASSNFVDKFVVSCSSNSNGTDEGIYISDKSMVFTRINGTETIPHEDTSHEMVFNGSLFLFCSSALLSSLWSSSSDCENWLQIPSTNLTGNDTYTSIASDGEDWVVGYATTTVSAGLKYSKDGYYFVEQSFPVEVDSGVSKVVYNGQFFLIFAIIATGTIAFISSSGIIDPINDVPFTIAGFQIGDVGIKYNLNLKPIIHINQPLALIESNGSRIGWSPHGYEISNIVNTEPVFDEILDICYNGEIYVAVGNGTNNNIGYSYDKINWIGLGLTTQSTKLNAICWTGDHFYAVGELNGVFGKIFRSSLGTSGWEETGGTTITSNFTEVLCVEYGENTVIVGGYKNGLSSLAFLKLNDAIPTWVNQDRSTIPALTQINSIKLHGNIWYLGLNNSSNLGIYYGDLENMTQTTLTQVHFLHVNSIRNCTDIASNGKDILFVGNESDNSSRIITITADSTEGIIVSNPFSTLSETLSIVWDDDKFVVGTNDVTNSNPIAITYDVGSTFTSVSSEFSVGNLWAFPTSGAILPTAQIRTNEINNTLTFMTDIYNEGFQELALSIESSEI